MSDTNTKKSESPPPAPLLLPGPLSLYAFFPLRKRRWLRGGGLTLQILAVNVMAPLVLVLGLLYMGQYRDNLIRAELETLKAQSQLFAGAIAEASIRPVEQGKPFLFAKPVEIETMVPELARRMVRRLGETTDSRTRLFSEDGRLIGDSDMLKFQNRTYGPHLPPARLREDKWTLARVMRFIGYRLGEILPNNHRLPLYPEAVSSSKLIGDFPDAAVAVDGHVSATAWQDRTGRIVLTSAAPVRKMKQIMGVVMLVRDGDEIEAALAQVRFEVLTVFLGSLSVTIFLSLYLAGIIGRPLKRLARAAEGIRQGKGRQVEIPDLSHRHDEIGELSAALRAMTQALWDRMDTIERFAADVAHEIKNPLTSLRSAVETAAVVKNEKDKDKLMEIIQHDVVRLDRLISDISNASRLDAELSRDAMGAVDLRHLLQRLVDGKKTPIERSGLKNNFTGRSGEEMPAIKLLCPGTDPVFVAGNEVRLAQVFENLISNALSFSPENGTVTITVHPEKNHVAVTVDDEGPGIPDNKLEAIFERFYSERPKHEAYGRHSGLGLSIARQIVASHRGRIWAENRRHADGAVAGARFHVILDRSS